LTYALQLPLHPPGDSRSRRDVLARRALLAAFALSLALHGAALWEWLPDLKPLALDLGQAPPDDAPLTAQLRTVPREIEAPVATPRAAPAPPPPSTQPERRASPPARPPVIAAERSPEPRIEPPPIAAPIEPVPQPPRVRELEPSPLRAPPAPAPTPPAVAEAYPDLSSYIAARRRARGEPAAGPLSAAEDDNARRNRIVAANLASINAPTFGAAQRHTGGLFQITQLSEDAAEFTFFGWNRDIKRRASQRIEVRRGNHPDIRLAVIRRMIAIIREHEKEDFVWRSNRLGRDVTLSARTADNEGLEQFMLREFFEVGRGG
jgi:hypothetical protein